MLKVIEGFLLLDLTEGCALTYNEAASLLGIKYGDMPNHEMDYRAGRTGIDGLFPMAAKVDCNLLQANDLAIAKVVTPLFDDCRLAGEPEADLDMWCSAPSTNIYRVLVPFPNSLITRISSANEGGQFSVIAKPSLTMYGDTAVEGYTGMFIEACLTAAMPVAPVWNVPPAPPAPSPYYMPPPAAPEPVAPWTPEPAPVRVAVEPEAKSGPARQLPSANEVIRGMFPLF